VTERVVVIGADAAGMSAASLAKRLRGDDLEVIAFDRGEHTSYSACGIPYWIAGDVDSSDDLVARTPEEHRRNGIDVRLGSEVTAIDPAAGTVEVRDAGGTQSVGWDHLVIATGAEPLRPDLPGIDATGVFVVQHIPDGAAVLAAVTAGAKRAVVVGAGYIGIEMAEAMVRRGLEVVVVDRGPQPMGTLDPDMGAHVHTAMEGMGIDVRCEVKVLGLETDAAGHVSAVATDAGTLPADLVVLGLGVRPAVGLARAAGLEIGDAGGIRTDDHQRVVGAQPADGRIWAGGDCVEVRHRITGKSVAIALGTHANRQGRVIGTNLGGREARFAGVIGTAVSKVCVLEIGRTGLGEQAAAEAGFHVVATTIESTTQAGYMPDAGPIRVKLIAERGTGRVLGGQIVGRNEGAAKRIDVVAMAVWTGMSAAELAEVDLSYAPPFSPLWDPVTLAARQVAALSG
jgi:NADPH-dependent 2,4-dienoyl-CoA reductase/sulfur reductase-like enzyme